MRLRTTTTILLALAAGLGACGGDDEPEGNPIPADAHQQLEARLDEVQRRFDFGGGACADIENDSQPAVQSILASLPQGVDPDVRSALEQSFDRLFQLTSEQCDDEQGQETTPEIEPPPETDTSIDTDTIPTETLPPETSETPAPPEEDPDEELPPGQDGEPPPGQGGDNPGQGNGGGIGLPGEGE